MPFTPSDTLVLDTARLRVWQQDDYYAYSRELVPPEESDRLVDSSLISSGNPFSAPLSIRSISRLMRILVGVFLVIGILLFLFYKRFPNCSCVPAGRRLWSMR